MFKFIHQVEVFLFTKLRVFIMRNIFLIVLNKRATNILMLVALLLCRNSDYSIIIFELF